MKKKRIFVLLGGFIKHRSDWDWCIPNLKHDTLGVVSYRIYSLRCEKVHKQEKERVLTYNH